MVSDRCRILLIEDNPANIELIETLLFNSEQSSLAQGVSFVMTSAESLSQAIEQIKTEDFDVILLDLMLPDSNGVNSLIKLREQASKIPIVVQTETEDETLIVKSFQLGCDGYLQIKNIDSNLLVYEIRLAIERKQYINNLEQLQQQQQQELEFQELEQFANSIKTSITARMFGSDPLKESLPDIFEELSQNYGNLLDLALEQRAYKVEHNISEHLRNLAEKLGFLKAGPRDVVELHTKTLREKNQDVTLAKAQAYVTEGRLLVLELMGYLTSFYRKYYIGLSNINIASNSDQNNQP